MKKILFFLVCLFITGSTVTFASSYRVNEAAVDELFSEAVELGVADLANSTLQTAGLFNSAPTTIMADDAQTKMIIATVVCWLVGGFGIHRYVLGTKSSMWAIYTFTVCGIFGIVPFVDFWVLIIGGIIQGNDKYIDNEKFFMW